MEMQPATAKKLSSKHHPTQAQAVPAKGSLVVVVVVVVAPVGDQRILACVAEELIDLGTHRVAARGHIVLQPGGTWLQPLTREPRLQGEVGWGRGTLSSSSSSSRIASPISSSAASPSSSSCTAIDISWRRSARLSLAALGAASSRGALSKHAYVYAYLCICIPMYMQYLCICNT